MHLFFKALVLEHILLRQRLSFRWIAVTSTDFFLTFFSFLSQVQHNLIQTHEPSYCCVQFLINWADVLTSESCSFVGMDLSCHSPSCLYSFCCSRLSVLNLLQAWSAGHSLKKQWHLVKWIRLLATNVFYWAALCLIYKAQWHCLLKDSHPAVTAAHVDLLHILQFHPGNGDQLE